MSHSTDNRLQGALAYCVRSKSARDSCKLTYIYAIECEGFVKIGIAKDVHKRLSVAQVSSPFELKLLTKWLTNNAIEDEQALHDRLEQYHVRGEWFTLNALSWRMIQEAKHSQK